MTDARPPQREASQARALVAACVRDLFFQSRIRVAAGAIGADVRFFRNAAELERITAQRQPGLVILDLSVAGLDPAEVVRAVRPVPVLAFGSHKAQAVLDAARRAGCDQVVVNSVMDAHLAELLQWYLGSAPP